ncbi:MAG TPA: hypothetical protein VG204_17355 [Terriglobia bacterium]|nr:hypothetical protein [Terriglobia bacterium]
MRLPLAAALACAVLFRVAAALEVSVSDFPQAEITNGRIRLKLYLPDAKHGYYRGTRFDWSGTIGSLEYKGHEYYGPWFDGVDPKVHDYRYLGSRIIASPCSADSGPADEFQTNGTALGWDEARVGGTFIKIGVGVLRKDEAKYDYVKQYEIVDPGRWKVESHRDSVEFTQELTDLSSGYGYTYRKIVRLTEGKPEMLLEHHLKNTGRRLIHSAVYNHNFLVLDQQPPGPDFAISVPFQIRSPHPPNKELAEIRGNQFVYLKVLQNEDMAETLLAGFSASPRDNEIRIENRRVGAGLRITGDHPLSKFNLWSIRTVLALEPFIAMTIEPGKEFSWTTTYDYYTLPSNTK